MEPKTIIVKHDMISMAMESELDDIQLAIDNVYRGDYWHCLSHKFEEITRILMRLHGLLVNPMVKRRHLETHKEIFVTYMYYIVNFLSGQTFDDRFVAEYRQVRRFIGETQHILNNIIDD